MKLKPPYLFFLGAAADPLAAKTAQGILDWRPALCRGQLRLPGCRADLKIPDLTLSEAAAAGAKTLIVGLANSGGRLDERYLGVLLEAIEQGFDLAAGLHQRLGSVPVLVDAARRCGVALHDVRYSDRRFETGTGEKRSGLRLLTVGTDCSVGKKYTALALEQALRARGAKADFRATGQTGILIAGQGVAIDAVVADFISGAAEWLSPDNDPDHWDVIEGQGSLFHPAFGGVTLGLLHGSQPDAFVVCHEPTRQTQRGVRRPLPTIRDVMDGVERAGRVTNPAIQCVGIAVNTAALDARAAEICLNAIRAEHPGLPVTDPIRSGTDVIVDSLLVRYPCRERSG